MSMCNLFNTVFQVKFSIFYLVFFRVTNYIKTRENMKEKIKFVLIA